VTSASAQDDCRRLSLDFIAECAEIAKTHARHVADFALITDGGPALEYSMRCMVEAVKAAVQTYREMPPKPVQAESEAG
jgi:hypothetical protein